jgi:hypothetical protein
MIISKEKIQDVLVIGIVDHATILILHTEIVVADVMSQNRVDNNIASNQ